jgi:dTDP-4-amino-4,6-dideoxygalactose transaminase
MVKPNKWRVPFLDLRVTQKKEKQEIMSAIARVLQHGRILLGPEVGQFEKRIARITGRRYAVGVNSGTDALFFSLKAAGVGPGDEVITTSLSWIATANAIALTGATPVFADIGEDLNILPQSIEKLISEKTKAIVPVHYTGKICRMDEITALAKKTKLLVIEDAAQSFGATFQGKISGAFGDLAAFSMNPMKVFAALGEAGTVVTDRSDYYEKLVSLRYNGTINKETCIAVSLNGRIDTLQAAVLLVRLKKYRQIINRRRAIALAYSKLLNGVSGIVALPQRSFGDGHYTYTVRVKDRSGLMEYLAKKGIETKIQHPILMPHQPAYQNCLKAKLVNAERIVKEILCLPANEKIKDAQVKYVSECLCHYYDQKN